MNVAAKTWILFGALSGCLAVCMGAFGAHALEGKLTERAASVYQTAAQYQMYHALALVAVGLWATSQSAGASSSTQIAGWAFSIGSVVFSGSLYALALTDIKILGAITPIGGLAFIVGWLAFAISAWKA